MDGKIEIVSIHKLKHCKTLSPSETAQTNCDAELTAWSHMYGQGTSPTAAA